MANKELKSIRFPGLTDTYTVNSMPDGAEANMQLVTDADGTAKWEEKPFYPTQEEITVTWDGDTTDREEIIFEPPFYKVSDNIIPRENMIGATFTITFEGGSEEVTITDDILIDLSEHIPGAWVLRYSDVFFMGSGPAFSEKGSSGGLYFTPGNNNAYASSLTFIGESINTIEQKYLPDIPAEKLPEIPADKLPEIPADKLPDSVCTVVQKTFEGSFDKVTDGRDTFVFNAFNYYKISDFSPRREDVISFSGTRASGLVYSTIIEGENCCKYGFFIAVYQAGQCTLESINFNAPSAGLYACYTSGNDTMTSGTYNFTLRLVRYIIQSSTTFKRYYLDIDDSGALIVAEVSE